MIVSDAVPPTVRKERVSAWSCLIASLGATIGTRGPLLVGKGRIIWQIGFAIRTLHRVRHYQLPFLSPEPAQVARCKRASVRYSTTRVLVVVTSRLITSLTSPGLGGPLSSG